MLGSVIDADDAVQETMVRAWRNLDGFDERSSLRTWLYRIATNVCLDALSHKSRRERPVDLGSVGTVDDALETKSREHWLEPIGDAYAVPADADPVERLMLRQSIRLAFVAAVQHLPPKQRAALLMTEVLGCSASEVAECLQTTLPAVNSALQRARETLGTRDLHQAASPTSDFQAGLVDKYVAAFESYNVDAITALLREDATLSMPPYTLWLRGHESIRAWLLGKGAGCRGSRLVPLQAAGAPAFGHYRDHGRQPWAIIVLDIEGDKITGMTSFLDTETLFPKFGLPPGLA